jgi:hypothetical protein
MRTTLALTMLLVASFALTADDKEKDKPTVKEIATKDLKIAFPKMGKATEPTAITSAEDLAKNPVVGAAADDIKKHIDFEKQKLLVFAWSGSGGDRITASIGANSDGKSIVFAEYLRGKTFDLRQHVKLYAVPKDLKVVVELGR